MAITSATVFDKVRIEAGDGSDGPETIYSIAVYNSGAFVDYLRSRIDGDGWDTETAEFGIVKDAITSGDATFEYQSPSGALHQAADLPRYLVWMAEKNPVKRETDTEQEIASVSVSGANLAIYKVGASDAAPTSNPPEFNATNNTIAKWRAAIEAAGYALVKPTGDAVGQNEVVWETLAYYEYDAENSQYLTDFSAWDTDGMRYSVDNGQTWTTEPPVSVAGSQTQYHVITHYQRYVDGTGWVTFTNNPENHTQTGVVEQRSKIYTATNQFLNRLGFNSNFPREWNAQDIQVGAYVGWELLYEDESDASQEKIGSVEYPANLVPTVYPHEITDENQESYGDRTFMVRMDQGGQMHCGRVARPNPLDYFADDHRFIGYFRGQPDLAIVGALSFEGATIIVNRKPTDVVPGMRLFLRTPHVEGPGVKREIVRTITVSQTPNEDGNYAITAQRGTWGTTAQNFPTASTLRGGGYNQSIRAFVITRKANLNRLAVMNMYKVVDR